ncbi:beta-lactamase family protein [Microbulbifer sp. CAU 1566]|uniref:serine hydrolase domain-containing protein n=1 Tax=Microbulbifer sp. CAU 1566 TaxID=2933269 RepID=UPI00200531F7|nr:serine hydrolase [Microbulbifer sp. CAU 1566]MCK7596706.1 beta-lactamase family protein [Microbulbifer sp. CAU 1566]
MAITLLVSAAFIVTVTIVFAAASTRHLTLRKHRIRASAQEAIRTLLNMSAKLACSARHISGFSDKQIQQDLRSYSLLFSLVRISHEKNTTTAKLWRRLRATAEFHPEYGARLEDRPPSGTTHNTTLFKDPNPTQTRTPNSGKKACCHRNQKLQALLQTQLHEDNRQGLETRALLVIHRGLLLAEAYGPAITPSTRLLGWSMTKSLLAMLWGRMEALDLSERSERNLFSEWEDDERSDITLEHLLQMRDGLAFDESYRTGSDATRMLFNSNRHSRYALQRPLTHPPGTHFSYSSGSTNLLARWMHQRLGGTEATAHFLHNEFLEPLGMRDTLLERDADGVYIGSSYGYATARDWGRLGALLLNEGRTGNHPLLDPRWIQRATAPNGSINDPRYGYQFWLNHDAGLPALFSQLPADSYFMLGNREQKLMIAPSCEAAILRLGWSAAHYPVESRFGEILAQLH